MPVKHRNGVPAYQRIQGAIRKRIDAGHLHPGDAVDSERDLAKIHQVSLMTARHALASLEQEGIVERRRGIGTFVAAPKIFRKKHTNRNSIKNWSCDSSRSRITAMSMSTM